VPLCLGVKRVCNVFKGYDFNAGPAGKTRSTRLNCAHMVITQNVSPRTLELRNAAGTDGSPVALIGFVEDRCQICEDVLQRAKAGPSLHKSHRQVLYPELC